MKQFSLLFVGYVIACVALGLAIVNIADMRPHSSLGFVANSLRDFYGVLIYTTGMLALYLAGRAIQLRTAAGRARRGMQVAMLPVLIGVIGTVDGYMQLNQILRMSLVVPDPTELYYGRLSMLMPLVVGFGFTTASCLLIALARLRRRGHRATGAPTSAAPPV